MGDRLRYSNNRSPRASVSTSVPTAILYSKLLTRTRHGQPPTLAVIECRRLVTLSDKEMAGIADENECERASTGRKPVLLVPVVGSQTSHKKQYANK
jgi:hypothetical protein